MCKVTHKIMKQKELACINFKEMGERFISKLMSSLSPTGPWGEGGEAAVCGVGMNVESLSSILELSATQVWPLQLIFLLTRPL